MFEKISSFLKDHLIGMCIFAIVTGILTTVLTNYLFPTGAENNSPYKKELRVLASALKSENTTHIAINALAAYGNDAASLSTQLVELLKNAPSKLVKAEVAFTLLKIQPTHPTLVPAFVDLLDDKQSYDFEDIWLAPIDEDSQDYKNNFRIFQLSDIVKTLGPTGQSLRPQLERLLNSERAIVSIQAAIALLSQTANHQGAKDTLEKAYQKLITHGSPNWTMIAVSIESMRYMGSNAASLIPQLILDLEKSVSGYSDDEIHKVVSAFLTLEPSSTTLRKTIIDRLKASSEDFLIMHAVLVELGAAAVPDLAGIIENRAQYTRFNRNDVRHPLYKTYRTLQEIGPAASSAVPAISDWLLDAYDPNIRGVRVFNPLYTLSMIGPGSEDALNNVYKIAVDPPNPNNRDYYLESSLYALASMGDIRHSFLADNITNFLDKQIEENPKPVIRLYASLALINLRRNYNNDAAVEIFKQWFLSSFSKDKQDDINLHGETLAPLIYRTLNRLGERGHQLAWDYIKAFREYEGDKDYGAEYILQAAVDYLSGLKTWDAAGVQNIASEITHIRPSYCSPLIAKTCSRSYFFSGPDPRAREHEKALVNIFKRHPSLVSKILEKPLQDALKTSEPTHSRFFYLAYLLQEEAASLVPILHARLKTVRTHKQHSIVTQMLGRIGPAASISANDILASMPSDGDVYIYAHSLANMGIAALPAIKQHISSPVISRRKAAITSISLLCSIAGELSAQLVERWSEEESEEVKSYIIQALGDIRRA